MSTQHRKTETFTPWVIRSKDHQVARPVLPNDPGVVIETLLNQLDSDIVGGPGNSFQNADVGNLVSGQIIDFTNKVYYVAVTLSRPNRPFLTTPPTVAAIRLFSS